MEPRESITGAGSPEAAVAACPMLYAADLDGCAVLRSLFPDELAGIFVEALERAGATIVNRVSHPFPGGGVTCVLVLSESHAVLHTWPENGTASIDIFSCSRSLRCREAVEELGRTLGARSVSIQEIPRAEGLARRPESGR